MTLRTRVAIVVVLLLVGWVFASPYRNSSKGQDNVDAQKAPTLQIRVDAPTAASLAPMTVDSGWAREDIAARPQPPRSISALAPMPISEAEPQPDTRLQPVRLLGVEFAPRPDRAEEHVAPAPVNQRARSPAAHESNIERRELPDIPPAATRWHRIVNGDSLQSIAKMYLGDEGHALLIYNTNHGLLDSPEFLPIGVELRIPDRVPPPASPLTPAPNPEPAKPLVPARIQALPKAIKELSPLPDSLGWRRPPDKERGLNGL